VNDNALTAVELAVTFANRERAIPSEARRTVSRWARNNRERMISRDEGRAFEIHTQTCQGCEFCRPSRGTL
jgi:NAD-dependent dihydropyrimidine dehydrogenase PreA subunit